MTPTVEDLRSAAFKAYQDEIDRLTSQLAELEAQAKFLNDANLGLAERNVRLTARLEVATGALKPFANSVYAQVETSDPDYAICRDIKVSDLKRAREALRQLAESG